MNTTRKPTTRSRLASGLFIPGLLIATAMQGPGGLPPAQAQTLQSCNQVLFSLGTDNQKCGQPGLTQQKCDDIAHTLRSTALAFLDGVLRGDALALQWLQRGEVAAATGGVAEWTRK